MISPFIGFYVERLISFWSWREVIVLIATMGSAGAVCLSGRALRPRLTLLPIYAAYELALNAACFFTALKAVPNRTYWYVWFYGDIAENALLVLLAIEIICMMMPAKKIAQAWSTGLAALAVLSILGNLPLRTNAAVLDATVAADFICGLALVGLLYVRELRWPAGYRQIVAGVVAPVAIHAVCALHWQRYELTAIIQAALPLASFLGLALFITGLLAASHSLKIKEGCL